MLLSQVSHGAIQFTAYEEFRMMALRFKRGKYHVNEVDDKKILVCNDTRQLSFILLHFFYNDKVPLIYVWA